MTTYYTRSHEWIRLDADNVATVGITAHASDELGELVFVEAKDAGTEVAAGDTAAVVESVKAASDIYAPVAGTVSGFNAKLSDEPALVGRDPEGEGWIYRLTVSNRDDLKALLTADQYRNL